MRITSPLLLALALTACTSTTLTSETLSDAEISAIQERVQEMHPNLPEEKQRAVVELAVNAMDNMVYVKGGSFMMGEFGVPCEPGSEQMCNSDHYRNNDHLHKVTLDSYHLAKYETTIADFDLFRRTQDKEPYAMRLREMEERKHLFKPNKPAWTKYWQEAQDYCAWVGKVTKRDVNLPTEAQWEYAARNRGKKVRYATDNGKIERGKNYPQLEEGSPAMAVGSYPPNPLGIYDMAFNAGEWMRDWYSSTYYSESPELNPQGPPDGNKRVFRAVVTGNSPSTNTTIIRSGRDPVRKFYGPLTGFRCAIRLSDSMR